MHRGLEEGAQGYRVFRLGDFEEGGKVDLPNGVRSGLRIITDILQGVEDISFMELTAEDVVRHRLIGDIVKAYEKYDEAKTAPRNLRNS